MITDLSTIKTFLQISDSSKDTLITALIPEINAWILNHCGDGCYTVTDVDYCANTITFDETNNKILDSDSQFVVENFADGNEVRIDNSYSNDGIYTIQTVSAGELLLIDSDILITEPSNDSSNRLVKITRIKYKKGLERIFSKMVGYNLQTTTNSGITQKSLADYSVKFGSGGSDDFINGYPKNIVNDLNQFRSLP